MLNYSLLFIATLAFALTSIIQKTYTTKNGGKDKVVLYNLLEALFCSLLYLILFSTQIEWNAKVLPYCLLWAGFATISLTSLFMAIKTGPLSLTSLLMQLSLILVTIYGLLFWNESFTLLKGIGIALIILSLVFNFTPDKNSNKINIKWLIFAILAMVCNAGTAIVQRQEQIDFNGEFGNMMLLFSELSVVAILFIALLFSSKDGNILFIKKYTKFPLMKGVIQAVLNIGLILLATRMPSAIVYPILAAGSLIIVYTIATTVYKEKLSIKKMIGVIVAIVAIVLLNI